ncbi:hypothetical protein [Paenibacillus senegalimassiliensis]|uniref:hypothetical protein n=1 Tax=Paenibacillus senegalimassiliensis TaxID=1737426 RepID=UPI0012FE6238|nr:hypothetical protein [Paenibacillus senegalimassiliensis]
MSKTNKEIALELTIAISHSLIAEVGTIGQEKNDSLAEQIAKAYLKIYETINSALREEH